MIRSMSLSEILTSMPVWSSQERVMWGNHKCNWSRARQCGRNAEGSGVNEVSYGRGQAVVSAMAMGAIVAKRDILVIPCVPKLQQ